MSPNNQNEYEILDASSSTSVSDNSVRYPLANDQTTTLQNMNYKDYLRMSEGENPELFGNPETFISSSTVQTGIGIVGQVLGALGVPFAGQIASFYSFIVGQLWPSSTVSVWEMIMKQVEDLIDQKITDSVRKTALAGLQGLGDGLDVYQKSLKNWLENRNDTRARSVVVTQYIALELDFVAKIPSFAISGQEVPLLSVYAQAANLHLLLLRDASIFGAEWGFTPGEISTFYDRQVTRTAQYSDYCVKWYNTGLDKLKGTNAASWLKYHQFRREMTLLVLDLVALFPNYDTRTYPIETTAQLTREVYTDPIVFNRETSGGFCRRWSLNSDISFSEVESAVIRSPHLFDILSEIEFYTTRAGLPLNNTEYLEYWVGHSIKYKNTNASSALERNYGTITSNKIKYYDLANKDIFQVRSLGADLANYYAQVYGVPYASFTLLDKNTGSGSVGGFTYSKPHTTMQVCTQNYNTIDEIPPENEPLSRGYSHRLSHITSYSFSKNASSPARYGNLPVFAWTHRSADVTNTVYSDKITQIPVVKAHTLVSGTTVIKGPGFTGGNILKRTSSGPLAYTSVSVKSPLSQRYRARIRYASTTNLRLFVTISGTRIYSINVNKTMNKGDDLTFNTFDLATIGTAFTFSNYSDSLTVGADSFASGGEVYVDKFELIPVNATFEAEEDLDVAKKAVKNLVECLSDELYPNEKRMLWDAVKEAKRLVQARNLLQDTGFNRINGENGWTGSTGIEVAEGDVLFKDRSLRLTSAREIDTETYPTYLYQQIDESLLKPYTRYKLKGFIGSSQDLEIKLIRHRANQIVKNVPDNLLPDVLPVNSCGGIDRCSEQQYVDANLALENNGENGNMSSDSHAFSFHIDTGEIDLNENTGIWVVFKIPTTNGYATLGNLELVEEGPLSGETLERAQQQEQQWQDKMARKRGASEKAYYAAKQAIDRLFADYQDQKLNSGVEMSDMLAAQNLVQSIPYVYNDALPEIPGMNYTSFTELTNRLQQAWNLYDLRNAIPNGDFRNGLSDWNATSDVNVQQLSDTSVLVIPNWNSQVSQQFTVQPNYRYVLRVTARKEGVGDGYVIIRDGANQTETLTFNICDDDTGVLSADQTSYITKTVEFTPSTEQVWIDMSETEGVFNIESVELVLEEE
uniref:Crystaline entomocidal protoxin n=2 Tax=Bacillus thuringiensis TaxID=1428 RepID=T2DKU5_BACTU|nr:Cry8Da [Bacillus thuringiensis]BAC07226.1 cry8 [Bacillus thuringiensis serovar galleriae]